MPVQERISAAQNQADNQRSLQETKDANPIPGVIQSRVRRGRVRKNDGASERSEIMQFLRGNQYVYRTIKGQLLQQPTMTDHRDRSGKPPHRMRTARNLFLDIIQTEVAASSSRVPSFECSPSTSDPDDISAAALAEKICLYGYDQWGLRAAAIRTITYAASAGEGFAWPYFDNTVGPFIRSEDGESAAGVGEVKVRVFGGNQVMWEPGCKFQESPWHAVELAITPEEVKDMEGFTGGPVVCDADSDDNMNRGGPSVPTKTELVLVTHYLERPSPKHPNGRWLTLANGRIVAGVEGEGDAKTVRPYPCRDANGKVIDEIVLHPLSYFMDPENDRDHGLGQHLLDPQRTYNDCVNKMLEWKNLAPVGQIFVTPGLMKRQRLTDAPGAIYEIPSPDQNVKMREAPVFPQGIMQILEQTQTDMARISAQNNIPSQVESGDAIQALLEKDQSRRAAFLQALAEWWSNLARHCLYLVQQHYSEERIIKIQGVRGPDLVEGFKGADLQGQADIRVSTGSIEPRTKQAIEQKIFAYADRGWIPPETAMAAINGGTAENLVNSYELDVAWINRVITKIKAGPDVLFNQPMRMEFDPNQPPPPEPPPVDPMNPGVPPPNIGQPPDMGGQPPMAPPPPPEPDPDAAPPGMKFVPAWMPRPFQNIPIIKATLEDWMKTVEYERLDPGMQEAANQVYAGLEQIEADKAQKAAEQQQQMAGDLGMANAAKPQGPAPLPDSPSGTPDAPAGSGPPTQNQPPGQSVPTS